jgi:hypothetical protein
VISTTITGDYYRALLAGREIYPSLHRVTCQVIAYWGAEPWNERQREEFRRDCEVSHWGAKPGNCGAAAWGYRCSKQRSDFEAQDMGPGDLVWL